MGTALKISLALIALALGLALAGGVVQGQQQGGRMTVDCEGNTRAIERECQFGSGQQFTVAIHVTQPPPGGYAAIQVKLRWDPDVLTYRPTEHQNGEAVWPLCVIPLRADNSAGGGDPSVLFGCVPFTGKQNQGLYEPSSYTGPVLLFHFTCTGNGSSPLNLVPSQGDPQTGTYFMNELVMEVYPARQSATVECGGSRVPRPDPEFGPRRVGPMTPVPPEATVAPPLEGTGGNGPGSGGQNGGQNGSQDQTPQPPDGTPDRTPTTEATPSPETTGRATVALDEGGDDGDGGFPLWAAIVIGIAVVGGLGAAGVVGLLRARGGGPAA